MDWQKSILDRNRNNASNKRIDAEDAKTLQETQSQPAAQSQQQRQRSRWRQSWASPSASETMSSGSGSGTNNNNNNNNNNFGLFVYFSVFIGLGISERLRFDMFHPKNGGGSMCIFFLIVISNDGFSILMRPYPPLPDPLLFPLSPPFA